MGRNCPYLPIALNYIRSTIEVHFSHIRSMQLEPYIKFCIELCSHVDLVMVATFELCVLSYYVY